MPADLLQWLLHATLASTAALGLVVALRKPVRRVFGAGVAYGLWWLVPVAVLAMWIPPAKQGPMPLGVATGHALPQMAVFTSADAASDNTMLWLLAWMAGVLVQALWLWRQQARFVASLGKLRQEAGMPGLLRARIVVPADFDQRFDADERMLMHAHERAHVDAGDLHANALVAALRCVFWFNPLVHWAAGRFRHDQEIACDARVLRMFPHSRRRYGEAMLKAHLAPGALPMACNWGLVHPFKERVLMLKHSAPGPVRWFAGVGLTSALTLGLGMAAWSAQPAGAPRPRPPTRAWPTPRRSRCSWKMSRLPKRPGRWARSLAMRCPASSCSQWWSARSTFPSSIPKPVRPTGSSQSMLA